MSNRNLIRLNTGAPDGELFAQGIQHSYFAPEAWQVISDKIRDMQIQTQTQNLSFGQTVTFEIDKTGTLAEDIKLDLTLSAITGNGGGTYARACDFLGLALIRQVQLTYQQNTIQTYDNNMLFLKHVRDHDITHRQVFTSNLAGGLTPAQRNTRATAPQKVRTYVKPYWYGNKGHNPIITALANRYKFKFQLANLQDFIQTDYASVNCSIQQADFVNETINTVGDERDQFSAMTFAAKGISYLIEDTHSTGYIKIPAGTQKIAVSLQGFVLPFSSIYFTLQRDADVSIPYQKKQFELPLAVFNNIDNYTFRDGTNAIFQTFHGTSDVADIYQKHHCGSQWGVYGPLGGYWATEIADLKNVNLGSFNAANINNFQLYIEFKAPLAEDLQLNVTLFEHNWVNHQGGEAQLIFN